MLALGASQYILKAEHSLDEIISTIREFVDTQPQPGVVLTVNPPNK